MAMRNVLFRFIALLGGVTVQAGSPLDVKIVPPIKEYCHLVRFSELWNAPLDERGYYTGAVHPSYEFRLNGLLGTKFIVAVNYQLVSGARPYYSNNKYSIDLSDPKASPVSVDDQRWVNGTTIPYYQESTDKSRSGYLQPGEQITFNNRTFMKSGRFGVDRSYANRLSPDRQWIVLQSFTGKVESGGAGDWDFKIDWGLLFGTHGKIFFDVYNVDTGKRLVTIEGRYSTGDPSHELGGTGWLTERYFIVPFGDPNNRLLVCEFSDRKTR